MRYALLALLLLCGSAQAQELTRACDKAVTFKHLVATGPVELVAAIPGLGLYFCGFTVMQKGQALDFQVILGQGVNCAVNRKDMTPVLELPSDFALTTRIISAPPITGSEGYAMCIQTTGTGKLGGIVHYAQF